MTTTLEIALAFGLLGGALTIASNLMKRMVPLRCFAMGANAMFIVQGVVDRNWIIAGLHGTLFAINGFRLGTLWRTLVELDRAHAELPVKDWLLPYMKKRSYKAGHVLCRKGDDANALYYLRRGRVIASDYARQTFGAGTVFGEIGVFAKDHKRAATLVCETDCVVHEMTAEQVHTLYLQNPRLGFFFMRLIVERLLREIRRGGLEARERRGDPSAPWSPRPSF